MKIVSITCCCLSMLLLHPIITNAQTVLEADASGNAYTVINNVLAPGATAVEAPDQISGGSAVGSHPGFGRHIVMVYDNELNKYVFQFLIHVNSVLDNDVVTGDLDRQRVEMKTYAASPANLKGTIGKNITYKWKFRLPVGFQPSTNFTHIHQLKAVDGDDSNPLFTLTPRYSTSGNTLQLIYVKDSVSGTITYKSIPLSSFLGVWVEATEQVTVGANGTYSISIKRVSDGIELLAYSNSNIQTIRPGNSFLRPKWGIYRSITSATLLRDDSLRIASVSITENQPLPVTVKSFVGQLNNHTVALSWNVTNEINLQAYEVEYSTDGIVFKSVGIVVATGKSNYDYLHANVAAKNCFYRLKLIDKNGSFLYSNVITVATKDEMLVSLYPNPAKDFVIVNVNVTGSNLVLNIYNSLGKLVQKNQLVNTSTKLFTKHLQSGLYYIQVLENNQIINNYPFIITK